MILAFHVPLLAKRYGLCDIDSLYTTISYCSNTEQYRKNGRRRNKTKEIPPSGPLFFKK